MNSPAGQRKIGNREKPPSVLVPEKHAGQSAPFLKSRDRRYRENVSITWRENDISMKTKR